ncbi:hypothetical protein [Kordia jejudonensis]|uniref:hypothetical protein n=1 Tax=Kordia jejudonensis TaxID=1348245 RepID=UPI000629D028|nr:hypothetical protein [Kordia jejudonensis]
MTKKYLNVNESILWDNLKRSANLYLREIAKFKGQERLDKFDPLKYPVEIEKLLVVLGKNFFKIFFFEAIKNKRTHNSIIKEIEEFKFYFWPGYTTLADDRIFITGEKKEKNQKYFTGIGNYSIKIQDKYFSNDYGEQQKLEIKFKRELEFYFNDSFYTKNEKSGFNDDVKKSLTLFKTYKNRFWVYDIPSSYAFDAVLNKFYIDEDRIPYSVPSTHYWKSSQIVINKYGKEVYMPMPLTTDGSELRILSVSIANKNGGKVGKNRYFISIKKKQIEKIGEQIAYYLSRRRLPVLFQNNHRLAYLDWPHFSKKKEGRELLIQQNLGLQAYSYWIANTLKMPNKIKNKIVANTCKYFNDFNLHQISERIKNVDIESLNLKESLSNHYFKYWETIFLESFSDKMDLGSVMFLTSHRYDSEFLMKCSNWLRWVYNELRILEATAKEGVKVKDQEFKDFKHDLDTIISAQNYFVNDILSEDLSENKLETLRYYTSSIRGLMKLKGTGYLIKSQKIDVLEEIQLTIDYFKLICKDIHRFNLTFRLSLEEDRFRNYENLSFLKREEFKATSRGDKIVFRLILKDMIENLIKHSNTLYPKCEIKLEKAEKNIVIVFLNTKWPDVKILANMRNNSFEEGKRGWRRIVELCETTNFELETPENIEHKVYNDFFWIKLKLPLL